MAEASFSQIATPEERSAFAWLWRTYLRQRMGWIVLITALVFLQSVTMVAFLHLLRTSLSNFFSSNNGLYELILDRKDANGDGVYEVFIDIEDSSLKVPVVIDMAEVTPQFDPVAILNAQGLSVTGQALSLSGPDAQAFTFTSAQTGRMLAWLALAMGFLMISRAVASYLAARLAAWLATNATLAIRVDLLTNLMALDMDYFDRAEPGRLVHRIFSMVSKIQGFFSSALVLNANHFLTVSFVLIYLAWVHLGLFLFVSLALPLSLAGVRLMTGRIRRYSQESNTAMSSFLGAVENTLAGMRTIKLTIKAAAR